MLFERSSTMKETIIRRPKSDPRNIFTASEKVQAVYIDYANQIAGHVVIEGSSTLTPIEGTKMEVLQTLREGFKRGNILVYRCGDKSWEDFLLKEPGQLTHIELVSMTPHGIPDEVYGFVTAQEGDWVYEERA